MTRRVEEANITTPNARSKLPPGRYYRSIEDGVLHLGYRKSARGGKWYARFYLGKSGRYRVDPLGTADDTLDANGATVLDYRQAEKKARERINGLNGGAPSALTVRKACEDYVTFLRAEKKTAIDAAQRLNKHILPALGDRLVALLATAEIDKAKWAMVRQDPNDPEVERRSKDSANRVLTSLKAALNRAFRDEANGIASDAAWRRVKPFTDVGRAREVHLDVAQSKRLVNTCRGAFRELVTAALLTGARPPHELAGCRVGHFRADLGTLHIPDGKTGSRDVVLTKEAVVFFDEISAGRAPDDLLLPRDNGTPWKRSDHLRPMADAVKRANLPKGTTIYSLRHTHASQSILNGANLKLLAENMGTSITMLEKHYAKFIAASRRKLVEQSALKLGLKPGNVRSLRLAAESR